MSLPVANFRLKEHKHSACLLEDFVAAASNGMVSVILSDL
jgi:hypothetical protein